MVAWDCSHFEFLRSIKLMFCLAHLWGALESLLDVFFQERQIDHFIKKEIGLTYINVRIASLPILSV